MESLLKRIHELIEEVKNMPNKYEEEFSYINNHMKNKQIDVGTLLDFKPSDFMLFLIIHLNDVKDDVDLNDFSKKVNKIKYVIDNLKRFDLFMYLSSLNDLLDEEGKIDRNEILNAIRVSWNTKYKENVPVSMDDPLEVIGVVSTEFNSIEDAMLFLDTILEVNDHYIIKYRNAEDPTSDERVELSYNFLDAFEGYAILGTKNLDKTMLKNFLNIDYGTALLKKIQEENKKIDNQETHSAEDYKRLLTMKAYVEFSDSLGDELQDSLFLLDRYCEDIKNIYRETKDKYKQEQKYRDKIYNDLRTLESIIKERLKSSQMKIMKSDFDHLYGNLKDVYLSSIFKFNHKKYLSLLQELEISKLTNSSELDKVLAKYNILITNEEEKTNLLNMISLEELESLLDILGNDIFSFIKEDEDLLIKILKYSSKDALKNILKFIDSEIITQEFIMEHPEVLMLKKNKELNAKYQNLVSNIHALTKFTKIKNIKKKSLELFLLNTNELLQRINILKEYGISLINTDISNFSILINPKQVDIVDSYIELGLYDLVKTNPEISRYDYLITRRINLYKEMNPDDNDYSISKVKGILKNDFYDISDNELEEYLDIGTFDNPVTNILTNSNNNIINDQVNSLSLISSLNRSSYSYDDVSYHFGDIIISKIKVLRCMSTLYQHIINNEISEEDALLNSIAYKSIISEDDLSKIKTLINGLSAPRLS